MHTLPATDDIHSLREFLIAEGYTRSGLLRAVQTIEAPSPPQRSLPRLLYLTQEPTRLNRLIRWFLGGVPVAAGEAKGLFPEWFIDLGLSTGILVPHGDDVASGMLIEPFARLLIASDTYQRWASAASYDHVLSLGPTAQCLLNFTIRRPVATTLDLGTGCGIQALLAAAHSNKVVATDLNPRAILFTQFNAALNHVGNLECLVGDLTAPVAGRQFELVVCNPPFVLAPAKEFLYRDSDLELDQLCYRLVREIPEHLVEGGFFQMLCDSVQFRKQSWQDRLREWFQGCGCDTLVLRQYSQTPLDYAQMRLCETLHVSDAEDTAAYRKWLDYYQAKEVESIHAVFIVMRKRSGARNWLVQEDLSIDIKKPFGATVLERCHIQDVVDKENADEPLMRSRLRLAPRLQLQHRQQCHDGAWKTVRLRLQQVDHPRRQLDVDTNIAEFLQRLDGTYTLAELIAEIVNRVDTDPADVRRQIVATVRRLARDGYLLLE